MVVADRVVADRIPHARWFALGLLLVLAAQPAAAANRRAAERAVVEAQAAVVAAERAGAADFARVEYLAAHDELTHTRSALRANDWDEAEIAARRTVVDAKLAETVSRKARAEREAKQLEDAVAGLRATLADGTPP